MSGKAVIRWTTPESVALTKAWTRVTQDCIENSDKSTGEVFWDKVRMAYESLCAEMRAHGMPVVVREGNSFKMQMGRIREASASFDDGYRRLMKLQTSGHASRDQRLDDALHTYARRHDGKTYPFIDCWKILQAIPEYSFRAKRFLPTSASNSSSLTPASRVSTPANSYSPTPARASSSLTPASRMSVDSSPETQPPAVQRTKRRATVAFTTEQDEPSGAIKQRNHYMAMLTLAAMKHFDQVPQDRIASVNAHLRNAIDELEEELLHRAQTKTRRQQ